MVQVVSVQNATHFLSVESFLQEENAPFFGQVMLQQPQSAIFYFPSSE